MDEPSQQLVEFVVSARAVLIDPWELVGDGAVAIGGGRILHLGRRRAVLRRFSGVKEFSFQSHLLLPGLVNAHTHLELSFLAGKIPPPAHFTDWVLALMAAYPHAAGARKIIAAAAHTGAHQSMKSGVTTVGDISRYAAISRAALRRGPLRVVSFGEITALGRSRRRLAGRLRRAAAATLQSDWVTIGLSPHAPYSVEGPALKKIVEVAERRRLPLAMHLAELSEERAFLASLGGPLGCRWEFMRKMNLLDERIPLFAGGPLAWAGHYGLLNASVPLLLAHVNYVDQADLELLARSRATVALCPRTRHYFGHESRAPHRWRDMLARGINVCLATDSLASNPDLCVLREAQFVRQREPDADVQELFAMLTTRPARALGLENAIGRLAPGFRADMLAVEIPAKEPLSIRSALERIIRAAPLPAAVWINGRAIFDRAGER